MSRIAEFAFGMWATSLILAAAQAPPTTITGTLVDRVRYTKEKNVANCAQDVVAAKNGGPVALITAEGEMYTVIGDLTDINNAKLVPHMCKVVSVTGETAGDTKNVRRTILATALKPVSK